MFSILLLLGAIFCTSAVDIPNYINICEAHNPELAKCIKKSINELRPQLKNGIPELDVPAVDPLYLDRIQLKRGPANAQLAANITDIKVWGPSSFELQELKVDLSRNKFAFKVSLPFLHFEGNYEIDMQILFVPFKGKGPIIGNFTNYRFTAIMQGDKIMQEGQEHLKFNKMKLKIQMGKAQLLLKGLFNSDPLLSQASNDLVNQNSDLFLNEIRPSLEASLAEKFTEISNKITLKFTYKQLFP